MLQNRISKKRVRRQPRILQTNASIITLALLLISMAMESKLLSLSLVKSFTLIELSIRKCVKKITKLSLSYNANGIDLRHNVMEEFLKRRDERLKEINAAIVMKDNAANAQLIKEIRKYNKLNPLKKRVYSEEKQITPLVKKRDISVTFTTLSFAYEINKHIGFNEVLQIILDVNNLTQESPLI